MMAVEQGSDFLQFVTSYENSAQGNDSLWEEFTHNTDTIPWLKAHRDHVEANNLGFGDRAFHYHWYLILQHLHRLHPDRPLEALEIGVYKGQVISLWGLISKKLDFPLEVTAVSPLEGNFTPGIWHRVKLLRAFRSFFDPSFRQQLESGNLYQVEDYEQILRDFYAYLCLDFDAVRLLRGYSTQPELIAAARERTYDLIYIDGDHTYRGVIHDLKSYAVHLPPGGILVMDDGSFFLQGSKFWKGHKAVSQACNEIEAMGFENLLNVGHNRVYRRL